MKSKAILAAGAALCITVPALATTPKLSGKYIVTITKFCQMVNTYHFSPEPGGGNYLDGINTSGSNFKQSMVAASFSPTKGTVTINGLDDGGDVEIFQLTCSIISTLGEQIAQASNSGKVDYSNTDTTFTIGGQTLNALYGQVNKNGVAGYFTFQGVFPNDGGTMCTEQGVGQAQ